MPALIQLPLEIIQQILDIVVNSKLLDERTLSLINHRCLHNVRKLRFKDLTFDNSTVTLSHYKEMHVDQFESIFQSHSINFSQYLKNLTVLDSVCDYIYESSFDLDTLKSSNYCATKYEITSCFDFEEVLDDNIALMESIQSVKHVYSDNVIFILRHLPVCALVSITQITLILYTSQTLDSIFNVLSKLENLIELKKEVIHEGEDFDPEISTINISHPFKKLEKLTFLEPYFDMGQMSQLLEDLLKSSSQTLQHFKYEQSIKYGSPFLHLIPLLKQCVQIKSIDFYVLGDSDEDMRFKYVMDLESNLEVTINPFYGSECLVDVLRIFLQGKHVPSNVSINLSYMPERECYSHAIELEKEFDKKNTNLECLLTTTIEKYDP